MTINIPRVGDTKSGFQSADHNGWYLLDGRAVNTLPSTASLGDVIKIEGLLGQWNIVQLANQQILLGDQASSVGILGTVSSTNANDTITLRCVVAGASTVWRAESAWGNIAFT
jgi:hypothetical protein